MHIDVVKVEANKRLDLFLREQFPDLSRSRIQSLIKDGNAFVNGFVSKPAYAVQLGDRVELNIPEAISTVTLAQNIPINIVYEDVDLLVINKSAGITVHPAPGVLDGTLVNALLYHCKDLSGINGVLRPGIVHRLDKDTTGLMVVAKSDVAHNGLANQLKERSMERLYTALVWGTPNEDNGVVDEPLDRNPKNRTKMAVLASGRRARTHFRVLERYTFSSLLKLKLDTGRTHQIRVHMEYLGNPVVGDPVYAGRKQAAGIRPELRRQARWVLSLINRQALHAHALHFIHPTTGKSMEFEIELPTDFQQARNAAKYKHDVQHLNRTIDLIED